VELGIIQLSLKSYDDALSSFEEALEMREIEAEEMVEPEAINECTLKIAKLLNNIGCVHYEKREFSLAADAFHDAINMQQEVLGTLDSSSWSVKDPSIKPGFLTMASTMCNQGYIELEQKNYSNAVTTFRESIRLQKLLLGQENKLITSTLDNLGYAYIMLKNWDAALSVSCCCTSTFGWTIRVFC
jgi:tetratricopeptide (TPR) repeat protein